MAIASHQCPAQGCQARVTYGKLICPTHWRMVPGRIGRALYAAWRNGAGAGTPEHEKAVEAAILSVNEQLAEAAT